MQQRILTRSMEVEFGKEALKFEKRGGLLLLLGSCHMPGRVLVFLNRGCGLHQLKGPSGLPPVGLDRLPSDAVRGAGAADGGGGREKGLTLPGLLRAHSSHTCQILKAKQLGSRDLSSGSLT
ncbi:unnamed protein product [Pleuronectes platessa]|uniref:Uncharacterized protein n=1 Tax=Pleuronectes platessa TaxID=8262 RepID=A0A9N7U182_PLEPL|nr:unnamed protein product [Pleuronectes platessa]